MTIAQESLQKSLEESLARHKVPGANVAIYDRGELVTAAAGVTNLTTGIAMTPETIMHIGSITKTFNATLVMQLVDEGKVDLEAPVLRYLPELKLRDRAALEKMTVKMMFNHTSGINGEILPDFGHDEEIIEKAIPRFAGMDQIFEPGTEFSYCNTGTVIGGYLVQRVRGESWYALVRDRIYKPLGMAHAATLPEEALLHRATVGHFLQPDGSLVRTTFAFLPMSFGPAGATLMMSANDLVTFARAHMGNGVGPNGGRILSEKSARAMRTFTSSHKDRRYVYTDGIGIGWMVFNNGVITHGGGGPGIVAIVYAHPETDSAIAVLTNAQHGATVITDIVGPWLRERDMTSPFGDEAPSPAATPPKIDPDSYAGTFEDVVNRFHIGKDGNGLTIAHQAKFAIYDNSSTSATNAVPLVALDQERFIAQVADRASDSAAYLSGVFAFSKPDGGGRMRFVGKGLRLYKRTA